ncbi:MAG: MATE family efflux transporter [Clostridia bacterium]|nr:MATE family efflux transporter [Clostridia bacterium]
MDEQEFEQEKLGKLIFKYGFPGIIGMFVLSLYMMIDGIFVGRGVGSEGLAAVNIAMPYINIINAVGFMLLIGGATYTAVELGKKQKEEANKYFSIASLCSVTSGMFFCIVTFLFANEIALLLGANTEIIVMVTTYMKVMSISFIVIFCNVVFEQGNRISGNPHIPMIGLIVSSFTNIFLDYLFIMVFGWGLLGAGSATIIGQFMGLIINATVYIKKNKVLKLSFIKPEWGKLKIIIYNGSSEFLNTIAAAIVLIIFNYVFMKRYGSLGVAAYGVVGYLTIILYAIAIGLSEGIQPIISYNKGAGRNDRIRKSIKISNIFLTVIAFVVTLSIWVFGREIVMLFIPHEPELIEITIEGAKLYSLAYIPLAINIMMSGTFTAIGKAKESLIIAFSHSLFFVVIGLWLLPKIFGEQGIWLSVPFAEVITIFISVSLYRKIMSGENKIADMDNGGNI